MCWPRLKAVRHQASRWTTPATTVATACTATALGSPKNSSAAKLNIVDIVMPVGSGRPGVKMGRSSPTSTSARIAQKAGR